jgi:hypothetical protein
MGRRSVPRRREVLMVMRLWPQNHATHQGEESTGEDAGGTFRRSAGTAWMAGGERRDRSRVKASVLGTFGWRGGHVNPMLTHGANLLAVLRTPCDDGRPVGDCRGAPGCDKLAQSF